MLIIRSSIYGVALLCARSPAREPTTDRSRRRSPTVPTRLLSHADTSLSSRFQLCT